MTKITKSESRPRIASFRGNIPLSRLRPGDWIQSTHCPDLKWCVLINSEAMQRMVIFSAFLSYEASTNYLALDCKDLRLIGRSKPRWWYRYLPRYIRDLTCPYGQP